MSIYRRKGSPHWWICIGVAGRTTRRSTGTADRRQAQEFEARERERLWRVHKLGDLSAVRFAEAAARWLEEVPERSRPKESSVIGWLTEQIGEEPLSAIDQAAIEELRQLCLEGGRSKSTVDRFMAILRAVLRCSQRWGYLKSVPVVPMFRARAAEMRWLSSAEFERLCDELPAHLELAARFAVLTGLRMRSMLQLTWDRVDLAKGRLWIPGEQMKAGSAHGLPIGREAAKVLRKLRTLSPTGERVFQYEGRPVDDCNTAAFQKAVERAGVGPLRWHDLRHTFAAWAVQGGVSVPELMALGGWKSHTMALRYTHLAPDHLAGAAEKVARSLHSHRRSKRAK